MSEISFFLPCVPPRSTHHAKKIVRVGGFSRLGDKPELVQAKAMLDSLLLPHQPKESIKGAVCLSLHFFFPYLASDSKKARGDGRLIPHTSRPDCSNLAKTLEDRLVALRFLEDDNAVVKLIVIKVRSHKPGIKVQIDSLERAQ